VLISFCVSILLFKLSNLVSSLVTLLAYTMHCSCIISFLLFRYYAVDVLQVEVQFALVHSVVAAQKSTLSRSCQHKLEMTWNKVRNTLY